MLGLNGGAEAQSEKPGAQVKGLRSAGIATSPSIVDASRPSMGILRGRDPKWRRIYVSAPLDAMGCREVTATRCNGAWKSV